MKEYVHEVPEHCDRIVWRGHYYSLANLRPESTSVRKPLPSAMEEMARAQHLMNNPDEPGD